MKEVQIRFTFALVALLLVGAFAGSAAAHGINEAHFTIRGMTFVGPDTLPAGMTTINVVNEDPRIDTFALVRLEEGKTIQDFFVTMGALFAGTESAMPKWVAFHGGSSISPDDARSYSIFLSPGTYHLISIGADAEGPYATRGLLKEITVTAPEPEADLTVTLKDYEFELGGELASGPQVLRVENAANQPHEFLIIALPEGVTLEAFLAGPGEGEHGHEAPASPAELVSQGVWVVDPGMTAFVTVDLAPGRYGIVCFVPDADGPHAMQGMTAEIEVR